MVWTVDGYTTSNAHPYSRSVNVEEIGDVNYMRNAVKATVDTYDGDSADLHLRSVRSDHSGLSTNSSRLLLPFSEMPADLRALPLRHEIETT